ncbi:MAG TPA: replication-relaxation family protein [Solirubrobacteraceae bacterium]|nr:replication-relaxation family protein [Solirubrobacteraceae bacterium]
MKEIIRPRRLGNEDVLRLASHLTERDRWIAKDCFEFRVLTSSQITRLHFTGTRTASARLNVLYRLRVLDRFRPSLPMGEGTAPYHWILDEAGALIVADHLNIERSKLGWQHSVAAGVAASQKLAHHVEVNEFFTRLAVEANRAGGALSEWYGERTCHHLFAGIVVADGYGVLNLPGRAPVCFLVELDRASEPTGRLRKKAEDYELHLYRSALRRRDPFVLVLVPSVARARTISAAVADSTAPITVAVWSQDSIGSTLGLVTDAKNGLQQARPTPAGEGLRSAAGSALLDHPRDPDHELELTP